LGDRTKTFASIFSRNKMLRRKLNARKARKLQSKDAFHDFWNVFDLVACKLSIAVILIISGCVYNELWVGPACEMMSLAVRRPQAALSVLGRAGLVRLASTTPASASTVPEAASVRPVTEIPGVLFTPTRINCRIVRVTLKY